MTGIDMTQSSVAAQQPLTFDRPFLFLVRDNKTGTVLFAAEVRNPVPS